MDDSPWPSPTTTESPRPSTEIDRSTPPASSAAVAGLAAVIGFGVGIAVGAVIGWLVYGISAGSCTPTDGWCDLGAAVFGFGGGVAAGGIAYVAAGVLAINRHRPRGQRAGLVLIHLAVPFALLLLLSLLGGIL